MLSKASSPPVHPSGPPPCHTTCLGTGRRLYRPHHQTHVPSPDHSANEVPPPIPFPPTLPHTFLPRLQLRNHPSITIKASSRCGGCCFQPIPNPTRPPCCCCDGPPTLSCSPATAPTPQRRWFKLNATGGYPQHAPQARNIDFSLTMNSLTSSYLSSAGCCHEALLASFRCLRPLSQL